MDKCSVSVVCILQIALNSMGLGNGPYQYISSHNWLIDSTQSGNLTCQPFDHHSFKEPNNFHPKSDNRVVLNFFCKSVTHDTYISPIKPFRGYNLTKEERCALEELQSNPNIVIKPANKGGKIVLQDTPSYIKIVKEHPSNTKAYRQVPVDQTDLHNRQVKQLSMNYSAEMPFHPKWRNIWFLTNLAWYSYTCSPKYINLRDPHLGVP